jgi:hypothetical protein
MSVFVAGIEYNVRECGEILKADMDGYYGWTSVWAPDVDGIKRRIKQVRSGGQ